MNRFEYPKGATPIDPDEVKGLILTHITTRGELDRWEQDNIAEALAWLDKTKPIDILNGTFIRKLHHRKNNFIKPPSSPCSAYVLFLWSL